MAPVPVVVDVTPEVEAPAVESVPEVDESPLVVAPALAPDTAPDVEVGVPLVLLPRDVELPEPDAEPDAEEEPEAESDEVVVEAAVEPVVAAAEPLVVVSASWQV